MQTIHLPSSCIILVKKEALRYGTLGVDVATTSGNKTLFSFIDKSSKSEIKMGNNGTLPVVGKGSIMVLTKQGEKKEIQNVYFAPGMKHNLMNIG